MIQMNCYYVTSDAMHRWSNLNEFDHGAVINIPDEIPNEIRIDTEFDIFCTPLL